jgi:hypothetical protein
MKFLLAAMLFTSIRRKRSNGRDMKSYTYATVPSAGMLLTSAAQAMEIRQFDKMAQDDRADYVSELIQGAEKILTLHAELDRQKSPSTRRISPQPPAR